MKDGKVKQALSGGYKWEGDRQRKKGEYGGCILYWCMKIEQ
jgi:hypothetical protein